MRVSNDKKSVDSGALESAKTGKSREVKENREARGGRGEGSGKIASQEKVEVSARAKESAQARAAAASAPDVREDKVAKLKQSVQNGSYNIDADKVASRMVDEHMETMF